MAIRLFLSSTLRRYVDGYDPSRGMELEQVQGRSLREVLMDLGIPLEGVKIVMVDGVHSDLNYTLSGEERVAVFPPVGGG